MKLNLLWDNEPLSGYRNIDPFGYGDERKEVCDLTDLSPLIDDAEVSEIIARDIVDFLPVREVPQTLNHWLDKLERGGRIVVTGVDGECVARQFMERNLSLQDFNLLIHGLQQEPHKERHGTYVLSAMVDHFRENNCKILKANTTGIMENDTERKGSLHWYVEAEKL